MSTAIPADEVVPHRGSIGIDPRGRLFEWNGELLRGVRPEYDEVFSRFLALPSVRALQERGLLIAAEETDYVLDGYARVVSHPRLPFVSYPFEWCGPMLKDAALAVLDVNLALLEDGFVIKDPSSWNLLFDGPQPVWVDFSGIWPIEDVGYGLKLYEDWFGRFYTYPLRLISGGNGRIARVLQHDVEHGVRRDDFARAGLHPVEAVRSFAERATVAARWRASGKLPQPFAEWMLRGLRGGGEKIAAADRPTRDDWRALFLRVRSKVEAIDIPVPRTKWSHYYEKSLSPASPLEGLSPKHRNVERVLRELAPAKVVDIGGSAGWFARLAASLGSTVAAFDADESAIANLYREERSEGGRVLPLVMDVKEPSPAYGLLGRRVASAPERLEADLAMALAVMHHLTTGQGLDFDQVVGSLALFTKRWLLVEWIDPTDATFAGYYAGRIPGWYEREAFTRALEKTFVVRETIASHPETRELLLCERR